MNGKFDGSSRRRVREYYERKRHFMHEFHTIFFLQSTPKHNVKFDISKAKMAR
jgi:hypothetical protein